MSFLAYLLQRPLVEEVGPAGRRLARRRYQQDFSAALVLAAALELGIVLSGVALQGLTDLREQEPGNRRRGGPSRVIDLPPRIKEEVQEPPAVGDVFRPPQVPPPGTPVPVPERATPFITIPTQDQLDQPADSRDTGLGTDEPGSGGGPGDGHGRFSCLLELSYPSPDSFVVVEVEPVLVVEPSPAYPELARMARVEGTVMVRVLVGKDGKVKDAILLRGASHLLDQAALDAARKAIFKPALQQQRPVPVWVNIPFRFALY